MRLVAVTAAIVMVATGMSAQQKPAGADEVAIAKIRTAYQSAAGSGDGVAMAKLYAPDGVELPPHAPAAKGRAAIEAFHKAFGQLWMMHGMTIAPAETKVSGNTAYDVGTYTQGIMSMKGGPQIDDKGKYVVLLKKDAKGSWWITHAIWNSDAPLPAPAAKK